LEEGRGGVEDGRAADDVESASGKRWSRPAGGTTLRVVLVVEAP